MNFIENWKIYLECPQCKHQIKLIPATKDLVKIILKENIEEKKK